MDDDDEDADADADADDDDDDDDDDDEGDDEDGWLVASDEWFTSFEWAAACFYHSNSYDLLSTYSIIIDLSYNEFLSYCI